MSDWISTLSALGARFHQDEANQVEDFGRVLSTDDLAAGFPHGAKLVNRLYERSGPADAPGGGSRRPRLR